MGLSENVVYPFLPNGFADHEIPMKNGYFIGNIPHFQTNPHGDDDEGMDGWDDGWMDGWMDGCILGMS